ncbi:hypothetical protein [Vibrio hyugaensis]|uniref:hypothetical protein n=1 Tax=Vibrio hyugaensis TaxID=1534743 RepID=UPI003DA024C5
MSTKTPVLFREPTFYIPVALLIVLSIVITIVISVKSHLQWNLTYEGFNFAIVVFRVPLTLLAVCGTWAAFVAANHRSKLAIAQIKLTSEQNVFTNYFKHLEEFEKYMAKQSNIKLQKSIRDLHDTLYGSFDMFQPRVRDELRGSLIKSLDVCTEVLFKFEKGGEINPRLSVKTWNDAIGKVRTTVGLGLTLSEHETRLIEHAGIVEPYARDYEVLVRETVLVFDVLENIMKFSMDSIQSNHFISVRLALEYKVQTGSLDMANLRFDYNDQVQTFEPVDFGMESNLAILS